MSRAAGFGMTGRVLGAVLAGGASSRFGSDKALAMWRGRTLLDRARGVLAPFVDAVVVVGRDGGIPDLPAAGLGPLGGIAGGLNHAAAGGFDSVMTIACDMPEVPDELLARLASKAPAYCADAPVLGHWPVALVGALLDRLAPRNPSPRLCAGVHPAGVSVASDSAAPWMPGRARHDGTLSVRRWATDIGANEIASPVPLANVNTIADLPPS